jgi:hypothetical protein
MSGSVATPAQPRVQSVEDGPADLTEFHRPERRHDGAPDIALISLPCGEIQLRDGHVPGEDVRDPDVGVRTAPLCRLLQQPAENNPCLLLGLCGLPVPERPAGQRVSPNVNVDAIRTARQSLYVTGSRARHAVTVTQEEQFVPQAVP